MSAKASQITSLTIVYSSIYSGVDKRKHQSSASLYFMRGIHLWPVNSPHKGQVTRKVFSFDDVVMIETARSCWMFPVPISIFNPFSLRRRGSYFIAHRPNTLNVCINSISTVCKLALRRMALNTCDDKSTFVQVMAWCRRVPSHYLNQCWPRSMSPYHVTRLRCVIRHYMYIKFCSIAFNFVT